MKKFKYLEEDVNLSANVQSGKVSLDLSAVRDNINAYLNGVTSCTFVTPYIALERVSKVLANYHIFLPKYTFMEGDSGLAVFNINQFGGKVGMNDDGEVVTSDDSPFSFYFEYNMNDEGTFDVFAEIVDEDELQELMSDLEDEFEDDDKEELNEEDNLNQSRYSRYRAGGAGTGGGTSYRGGRGSTFNTNYYYGSTGSGSGTGSTGAGTGSTGAKPGPPPPLGGVTAADRTTATGTAVKNAARSMGSSLVRGIGRVAGGPLGALVGMTTSVANAELPDRIAAQQRQRLAADQDDKDRAEVSAAFRARTQAQQEPKKEPESGPPPLTVTPDREKQTAQRVIKQDDQDRAEVSAAFSAAAKKGTTPPPPPPRPQPAAARPAQQPQAAAKPAADTDPFAKSKAMFQKHSDEAMRDNDSPALFFAADKQRQAELRGLAKEEVDELVAEGRADNKAKKREALRQAYGPKRKLRDIRAEIKGKVSDFDPRELRKEEACLSGPETGSRPTPGANPTMITTGITIPNKLMKKKQMGEQTTPSTFSQARAGVGGASATTGVTPRRYSDPDETTPRDNTSKGPVPGEIPQPKMQYKDDEKNIKEEKMNRILEACWKGYRKKGMKTMFGKRYPNCVKDD